MSTDRSGRRGIDAGPSSTNARTRQKATPAPAAPPSIPRTRLSVSNCAISWRRLAPRAARTATSRPRACPRASSRFATFAQAMSSTSVTEPKSGHQRGANVANNPLVQRSGQQRRVLFCLREIPWPGDRPPFAARWSPGRPTPCPSSAPTPAPTVRRVPPGARSRGLKMSGCQNSAAAGNLRAGRSDPDNRHVMAVERRRRVHDVRTTAESTSPQAVRDARSDCRHPERRLPRTRDRVPSRRPAG